MCRKMLTILKKFSTIISRRTNVRINRFYRKGNGEVTKYENELIELVRENDNPEQAVMIVIDTIISFLEQHESSPSQEIVAPPGRA